MGRGRRSSFLMPTLCRKRVTALGFFSPTNLVNQDVSNSSKRFSWRLVFSGTSSLVMIAIEGAVSCPHPRRVGTVAGIVNFKALLYSLFHDRPEGNRARR